VTHLISAGLLETRPGIGTVVATAPQSTAAERTALLRTDIEQLVVEARKLGIEFDEMIESISTHWKRLGGNTPVRGGRSK
jgi:GntR family transcriptional regulator